MIYKVTTPKPLDRILWEVFGSTDLLEEAIELNPHLLSLDPVLPMGTQVNLPEIEAKTQTTTSTKRLWS